MEKEYAKNHTRDNSLSGLDSSHNTGRSLSPPPFQLKSSSAAPMQLQKIAIDDENTIDSSHHTLRELQDLKVRMIFAGKKEVVQSIQDAIDNGEYMLKEDQPDLFDLMTAKDDDSLFDEELDSDYLEIMAESQGMRLMQPGIDFVQGYKDRKKKPLNLNKAKGEMFELAFDMDMEEQKQESVSTNEYVSNCPGFDHLSPFGDRVFEQSKCYTTGSNSEIAKTYLKTSQKFPEMSELLLNKALTPGKIGGGLTKMLEDQQDMIDLEFEEDDLLEDWEEKKQKYSLSDMVKDRKKYNENDSNSDFFSFDKDDKFTKSIRERSYMQVPEDIFMELMMQTGGDSDQMDGFSSNGLTIKQIRSFEQYATDNDLALTPKAVKKRKLENEDQDFIPEKETKEEPKVVPSRRIRNRKKKKTGNRKRKY